MATTAQGRKVALVVTLGFWGLGVSLGMAWLLRYSLTASPTKQAAPQWPSTVIGQVPLPALILAVHPYCPCTDASLEELSRVVARSSRPPSIRLLFYSPLNTPKSWTHTALWQSAALIPNTKNVEDIDGALAQQFGLSTSGEAALYDAVGKLVFHGGITSARGHAGDNYGADSLIEFANAEAISHSQAPVFGCSLLSSETRRGPGR